MITGSFTATGQSAPIEPNPVGTLNRSAPFNISLWGTFVGTVTLERSFDGTTWLPKTIGTDASFYTWTAPLSMTDEEPEALVQYRLNCTSYTSGTINYRISQ